MRQKIHVEESVAKSSHVSFAEKFNSWNSWTEFRILLLIFHFEMNTALSRSTHVTPVHERHYQKVCHLCPKVYSTSTIFRLHVKLHSDVEVRRVVYQLCGRLYKNPNGLGNHMATHKVENQFLDCPQCPKISPNRITLTAHIRVMHNNKVHKCLKMHGYPRVAERSGANR